MIIKNVYLMSTYIFINPFGTAILHLMYKTNGNFHFNSCIYDCLLIEDGGCIISVYNIACACTQTSSLNI